MTKIDYQTALAAVVAATEEINFSMSQEAQISTDPEAVLYGEGSTLDSVGRVQVVMAAEAHLSDATGQDIVLASEAAMSRKRSPYRSLKRLAEYAVEISGAEEDAA